MAPQGQAAPQGQTEGTATTDAKTTDKVVTPKAASIDLGNIVILRDVEALADKLYADGVIKHEERGAFVARAKKNTVELNKVMTELQALAAKSQADKDLTVLKNQVADKLYTNASGTSPKIGGTEYTNLDTELRAATTTEAVNTVLAKIDAIVSLYDAKAEALGKLAALRDKLGYVATDTIVKNAEAKIMAAKSVADIDAAFTELNTDETLKDTQAAAVEKITVLYEAGKITGPDWHFFNNQITAAATADEVAAVTAHVDEFLKVIPLRAEKIEELEALKAANAIDGALADQYISSLSTANTLEQVNTIMAKVTAVVDYEAAMELAHEGITALLHNGLDQARVNDYIATINLTTVDTSEKVLEVLANAKTEATLNVFKANSTKELDALRDKDGTLNAQEANDFWNKLTAAETLEAAEAVMKDAKDLAALNGAKDKATADLYKEVYNGTINMKDYYRFNELVDAAKTPEEAAKVVVDAVEFGNARTAAVSELEGYAKENKLTLPEYKEYLAQVEQDAKTKADIDKVMKAVRAKVGVTEPTSGTKPTNGTKPAKKVDVAKKATTTKAVAAKKADAKKLPQTNDTVNGGLVAGGLLSMLAGAFVFFKKGK